MIYTVHFQPGDRKIDVLKGTPLEIAAAEVGFSLRSDCGGAGTCRKCKVYVNGDERLACQVVVDRNLEVILPSSSLQLETEQLVVQQSSFLPTENASFISPNRSDRFGVALDIGTTTLAAELFELSADSNSCRLLGVASQANPQRSFGDDVIARIQKVIDNPSDLAVLQASAVGAVDSMLQKLAEQAEILPNDISFLSVAGNTVMEHLFLGIDPSPLGYAPFIPPVSDFPNCRGADIGLKNAPDIVIETMPIFGGFVGGDIVAGVLATDLIRSGETAFLIDIGTNGELALCHEGELYTAATAAGPAFEGGRIEYGCLAVPGAIDQVELRADGDISISTIGGKPAIGICGSGLIDAASELLRHGLLKATGQFQLQANSPFLNHWKMMGEKPSFQLVSEKESGRGESILLLQRDIRQLQLATGAIRAGIQLLLKRLDLNTEDVRNFYVAGGFGSFIRAESARRIGLLPREIPLERIRFCGNTSLAGARLVLLDPRYREQGRELARQVHHLDLAALPDFATVFADCMMFYRPANKF